MYTNFEYVSDLQYKVKALKACVHSFETGEIYKSMNADFKNQLSRKTKIIAKLKAELGYEKRQFVKMRNNWLQVFDDLEEEHIKAILKKDRIIKALEERALKSEILCCELQDKIKENLFEIYQVKSELEEEKGKNQKLIAQINRDYENSSKPSSEKPNHRKITNNREKSGKKPGAQIGHTGHKRKRQILSNQIEISAPEKYANSPDYRPTGKTIRKQLVDIHLQVVTKEYYTPEFRHVRTGQRVHAEFPLGVVNDVNYNGSVKAFAFLLNSHCNVSIAKTSEFLSELTNGAIKLSTGMISKLTKVFAQKTEADQAKAFNDLLLSPVMNIDFTTARVNGKNINVVVCANKETAMYFARDHKGHEGVKGTPIEDYQGVLVHDHDKTFYKYGQAHQECLEHTLRYLKDSIENEKDLKWNKQMRELIREMIHFRKGLLLAKGQNPDQIEPDQVNEFERRYDEILEIAKIEYEYEPPSKYYKEGFNLYKRLRKYRENHLFFLHNQNVSYNNNLSERLLRVYKRKQRQVITFRSDEGISNFCKSLGTIASLRLKGENLYKSIITIFER